MKLYPILLHIVNAVACVLSKVSRGKMATWYKKKADTWDKIEAFLATHGNCPLLWVHVSSRGESEQALPLITLLKQKYPTHKVVMTIFSPSAEREIDQVDLLCYLPLDSQKNAKRLLELLQPKLILWVKYDFWYFYLTEARQKNIPLVLISAVFRKKKAMFHPLVKSFYLKMLSCFDEIHVQNEESKGVLSSYGIQQNVHVSGDTRFDRVCALSTKVKKEKMTTYHIESYFPTHRKLLVCGSTHPEDYPILAAVSKNLLQLSLIIVPHEVEASHIKEVKRHFPEALCLSQIEQEEIPPALLKHQALIVDRMGILIHLYAAAHICYVGGGFSPTGIHNVLEPATFGKPVLFGSHFKNYCEAVQMVERNAGLAVQNSYELIEKLQRLCEDRDYHKFLSQSSKAFVGTESGASEKILSHIALHSWLP